MSASHHFLCSAESSANHSTRLLFGRCSPPALEDKGWKERFCHPLSPVSILFFFPGLDAVLFWGTCSLQPEATECEFFCCWEMYKYIYSTGPRARVLVVSMRVQNCACVHRVDTECRIATIRCACHRQCLLLFPATCSASALPKRARVRQVIVITVRKASEPGYQPRCIPDNGGP